MASAQLSAEGISIFSQNILKMLGANPDCDVDFQCGTETFRSNKLLLAISSSRFSEMFEENKDLKVIQIKDVHSDIFKMLLDYINNAKIDELDMNIAPALYEAAELYKIYPLKRLCGSYIIRNIDEENALRVLLLAEKYHTLDEMKLMKAVTGFVFNNRGFLDLDQWRIFSKRYQTASKMLLDRLREAGVVI